jgi:Ran GTPase-activating protein (RanGAP) involved in mRNA processing and transport
MYPLDFIKKAKSLFRLSPASEWKVNGSVGCLISPLGVWDRDTFSRLASCRFLNELTALDLSGGYADGPLLEPLLRSRYLTRLETLDLGWNSLSGAGVAALAAARLPKLRVLVLCDNDLVLSDLEELVSCRILQPLTSLAFSYNAIGDEGLERLATVSFGQLASLDLSGVGATAAGFSGLLASGCLKTLRKLDLYGNDLGEEGAKVVADAQSLSRLEALDLASCGLTAASAQYLARSKHLNGLQELSLYSAGHRVGQENRVGNEGVEALAASPFLKRLRELYLEDNQVSGRGVKALAGSPLLARLTGLDLSRNPIGTVGARVLASSPNAGGLKWLNLKSCAIDDAGAHALAKSPHLGNLETLWLMRNRIGPAGLRALIKRFGPEGRILNGIVPDWPWTP